MSAITMTFVEDRGEVQGQRYRVGCLACGWLATTASWRAALRAERVHQCTLASAPGSGREG